MLELFPHPTLGPQGRMSLRSQIDVSGTRLRASFDFSGAKLARLPVQGMRPQRCDRLWEHTCFELFLQPENQQRYWEVNFAPSGDWNCYSFSDYRAGMAPEVRIENIDLLESQATGPESYRVSFNLDLGGLGVQCYRLGVTSVIELEDGTKSYWAIAHAGEKPDFHNFKSFTHKVELK